MRVALGAVDKVRGTPPAPAAVPPGYALVPVEPTKAMTEAGEFSVNMNYMDCLNSAIALHAYRAMIAAAPKA